MSGAKLERNKALVEAVLTDHFTPEDQPWLVEDDVLHFAAQNRVAGQGLATDQAQGHDLPP
jgi:hypothetical protein